MQTNNKAQAAEQTTYYEPPLLLGVFYGVLTAIVGLPCWVLGIILGVQGLQSAWGRLTFGIIETIHGERLKRTANTVPQVSDYVQHMIDEDNLLNIAVCADGSFLRFIRRVDAMGMAHRVDLNMIVPGELTALGLEQSMDAALAYTLRQFEQGILAPTPGKVRASAAPSQSPKPSQASESETAARDTHSQTPPQEEERGDTESQAHVRDTAKHQKSKSGEVGKIIFAGNREYPARKKGEKPYTSFAVRLQTDHGEEVEFSGVDLQSRFSGENSFAIGQRVRIVRHGRQPVEVVENGERVTKHRNCFGVYRA